MTRPRIVEVTKDWQVFIDGRRAGTATIESGRTVLSFDLLEQIGSPGSKILELAQVSDGELREHLRIDAQTRKLDV